MHITLNSSEKGQDKNVLNKQIDKAHGLLLYFFYAVLTTCSR